MRTWLICLLLAGSPLWAQVEAPHDLFAQEAAFNLHLRLDLAAFLDDRSDSAAYHPGFFHFTQGDEQIDLPVRLKARGNFRRDPRHCDMPPIKVRLEREDRTGTPFAPYKKLKLVTACQDDGYVLREYLVYRAFQCLSPESFRVRLVRLTFEDIHGTSLPFTQYAFFIEDDEYLAKRLGGELLPENVRLRPDSLDPESRLLVYLFQYMIGNTDWDVYLRKNIELIRVPYRQQPIAVPYDFDWSAAVDAPYILLGDDFDRRVFRKMCPEEPAFAAVAARFEAAYDDIRQLYRRFPEAGGAWTREPWQYCQTFYKQLREPDTVQTVFMGACAQEGE